MNLNRSFFECQAGTSIAGFVGLKVLKYYSITGFAGLWVYKQTILEDWETDKQY